MSLGSASLPELSNSRRPAAVVVGLCSHGLAIVRSLSRRGVPVIAIESNWTQPSAHTRFGRKIRHGDLYGTSLVDLLVRFGDAAAAPPVVFVTNDKMLRLLNAHRPALEGPLRLPFPRQELVTELIEKDTLGPLALRQGLRIPRSTAVTSAEARDPASPSLRGAPFPCVVKPATPMSSIKALRVADARALAAVATSHPEIDRYLLQEWIEGGDDRVYFVAYYWDRAGALRASFAGQKIRQTPRTLGNSTAARRVDRPDLVEEGLRLFRGLDYRGIGSVEFKLAPDGTPYFIEATVGRSDYWLKTLIVNGLDLPALVYSDLGGVDVGPTQSARPAVAWVDGDRDLPVYLESWRDPAIPKRRLVLELLEPKRYALFDAGDPVPYWHWLRGFAAAVPGAIARRLRRRGTDNGRKAS